VTGLVVLGAGAWQFTTWKARHLDCCRELPQWRDEPAQPGAAWRDGLRLGVHCASCSAGFTAILLAIGVMNLVVMAVVGMALTAERIAAGDRVSRGIGAVAVASGLLLIARAISGSA
jgi:predicted metal-binding membrane protein